jgi:hypothetical protein
LPIFFLQHRPDRSHVFGDVAEQRHDSCDVSVLDRPLDVPIVALILRLDKCRFRTFSIGISASSSAASTPVASPRLAGAHFANPRNDFVGKEAYRGVFGERAALGVQERTLAKTCLFVLPSTSPANATVPWDERLRWFCELAELSPPREPIDVGR